MEDSRGCIEGCLNRLFSFFALIAYRCKNLWVFEELDITLKYGCAGFGECGTFFAC